MNKAGENYFFDWQGTMVQAALGGIMGTVRTWDKAAQTKAVIVGDFCYFAGAADAAFVVKCMEEESRSYMILIPEHQKWEDAIISAFGSEVKKFTRYAMMTPADGFNREILEKITERLPGKYELREIDCALFDRCRNTTWCKDLVSQFASWEQFAELGAAGIVCLCKGTIVSGASAYAVCRDSLEIEVDTREDYRRQGLAEVCSAALILQCLARGIKPHWDAHNTASLALAQKLGYELDFAYTAYELAR